jgi:hypothetical protein
MIKCKYCGKETNNPNFCSRSCSAKMTNKIPKRKRTNKCIHCKELILSNRQRCPSCINRRLLPDYTIKEAIYDTHHRSSAYSLIRARARKIYKESDKPQCCVICGYDKHFEVCHIKPISEFKDTTAISVVNHIDNLIALCPTHHWEFDNELITPERLELPT